MVKNKFKKAEKIEKDQDKLYLQGYDLISQALHICIVRDVVKQYRYQMEKSAQKHNLVMNILHVALSNYSLQQLWKLFDKKSVFNVRHLIDHIPHSNLKIWFKEAILSINDDLKNIEAIRHNLISHRSDSGHVAYKEFDKKFFKGVDHEEKIRNFLLDFLSQMKFEMQGVPVDETKKGLLLGLDSYREFIEEEFKKVFRKIK